MKHLRFKGFRKLCEDATDYQSQEKDLGKSGKGDFQKSNMDGVMAHDLNIVPGNNDDKMDTVMGASVSLSGHGLKQFNKLMGFEDNASMKLIRVKQRNQYGVQIEDISGKCDSNMLNMGRDGPGTFASRPNVHTPCSPTSGRSWWISAKDWDFLRMHIPSGGGAAGGGMGGAPMGGGAAPAPAGGGAPPPPPA